MGAKKPDIFDYHDYREFLRDQIAFKKAEEPEFHLSTLAERAALAKILQKAGYLNSQFHNQNLCLPQKT